MKNAKLQFDEATQEYLSYAALIDGKTPRNFLRKLRRQYGWLHTSCKKTTSLQYFVDRGIFDLVETYEEDYRLPSSLVHYDKRESKKALNRAWDNMVNNREDLMAQ